jgi:NIMA (never in mitosis gene a)-related kinase
MSPEQITESGYDEKSDIWSLGCVLYELCQLSPPFEATNHLSLANKIMAGNFAPISPKYSSELSNLITSMLNVDPRRRPTIEEISNQPTLNSLIQTQILQLRYQQVKKREEETKRIVEEVKQREKLLDERERAIELREKELRKLEIMYNVHRSETPRKVTSSENKENLTPTGNIYKNFKYN